MTTTFKLDHLINGYWFPFTSLVLVGSREREVRKKPKTGPKKDMIRKYYFKFPTLFDNLNCLNNFFKRSTPPYGTKKKRKENK
jgi:hypothetical protein